jgi:hypothetical protein
MSTFEIIFFFIKTFCVQGSHFVKSFCSQDKYLYDISAQFPECVNHLDQRARSERDAAFLVMLPPSEGV